MANQKQAVFSWWMWLPLVIGILCLIFRFDPIGDAAVKLFGEGARLWATNIIIIAFIIYVLIRSKKKNLW